MTQEEKQIKEVRKALIVIKEFINDADNDEVKDSWIKFISSITYKPMNKNNKTILY